MCAGFRKIASRSILVALSLIDKTGNGGGEILRLDCCITFGIFMAAPDVSPENIVRDGFTNFVSALSDKRKEKTLSIRIDYRSVLRIYLLSIRFAPNSGTFGTPDIA